jgi:hypothetical protein
MSFVYDHGIYSIVEGEIDFGADTFKIMLVMSATTCDTDVGSQTMGDSGNGTTTGFQTTDEADTSGGYTSGFANRPTLANVTVTEDTPNTRTEVDADNFTFTALTGGTSDMAGIVIYKHITDDASSTPIVWEDTGMPFDPSGGDLTYTWNAEGIIQFDNA